MNEHEKTEARALVRRLIELVGDDPGREGLLRTPQRVVDSWSELYSGYEDDCARYSVVFDSECDDVVLLTDIEFFSTCEHHMLPFHGHANIAYIPDSNKVLGVSKLARIVNAKARKLQIQERLTREIAQSIEDAATPKGVLVTVSAAHLCMVARGTRQHNTKMVTSHVTGVFREDAAARAEVFSLINYPK